MLQLNLIRENPEFIINRLAIKGFDASGVIREIIQLDDTRRSTQKILDEALAESNRIAKEIGQLFRENKQKEAEELKSRTAELKTEVREYNTRLDEVVRQLNDLVVLLPNLPHESVPVGRSAEDNQIVHTEGTIPKLGGNALPHWDLATRCNIIDFDLGSKVTGAGFPFYRGKGARLQRALINFFIDQAVNSGYVEYQTPLMVNEASGYGTGQLPDKDGQMYHATLDNYYLIPTAEVPLTNIYRDVILPNDSLPIKIVAYSSCFRREAGSYGKDVRGLNRLHQFDKVEIVQVQHPENSYRTLEEMKDHVASLVRQLDLPFRIVKLCGGDMSFTSALTYDFEVYSAAQGRWLEVSSVSNFENFQSNRMKLRFRDAQGKTNLAHTLNGSALALPRIVAALLENNQDEEGINIPDCLQSYTGFDKITL